MALFELNRKTTTRELRLFAGLWFPALCAMVGLAVLRKSHSLGVAQSIWGVGAALSLAGLCVPPVIKPVYRGLMWLTFPVGWVLSHVLLFGTYYLVFTPLGFLIRKFQDPMERRFDRGAKTYWLPRESRTKESYLRQL